MEEEVVAALQAELVVQAEPEQQQVGLVLRGPLVLHWEASAETAVGEVVHQAKDTPFP